MTITTVVAALQTLNASVTGIKNAPTKVPSSLNSGDLPTVIVWPSSSSSGQNANFKTSQRTYTITAYIKPAEQGAGVFEGWNETKNILQSLLEAYLDSGNVILVSSGGYNASIRNDLDESPVIDNGIDMYAYPPPATGVEGWPHYFGCQFQVTVKEQW